jgi:uncharacterized damage-inducible protein DinB
MSKERALKYLARSREELQQAIQGLSEDEMTQVPVEGVWTIKDVLGHLTSWEEALLQPLRSYADGGPFDGQVIEDYLAWNDEQAALKKDLSLDAILDELTSVRQKLVATANRLSDRQYEQQVPFPWGEMGTADKALHGLSLHEREHLGAIQKWRQG